MIDAELRVDNWISIKEAAERVGVTPQAIYGWVNSGDVKTIPGIRRKLVSWEDVVNREARASIRWNT